MRPLVLLLTLLAANTLLAQRTFDVTIADSTYHMKQYWFVLYTKGDAAERRSCEKLSSGATRWP